MKNAIALLASRLVVPLMSTVLVFVLARKLGLEGMGVYATVMALVNLSMSASSIGIRNILIREIGREAACARQLASNSIGVVLILSIATYAVLVSYSRFVQYPAPVMRGVAIAGLSLFAYAVAFVIESALIALGSNVSILKGTLLQHGFRVAASALVLMAGFHLTAVFVVFVTSNLLLLGWYVGASASAGLATLAFDWKFIRSRIVSAIGVFSLLDVIANVYAKLGVLVLSSVAAPAEVGLFAAAIGLSQIVAMVPANLALGLYPRFAAIAHRPDEIAEEYRTYLRRTAILLTPIVVLSWAYAGEITRLLYGERFASSSDLFRIALLGVIPYTLSIGMSYILLGTNRQRAELAFVSTNTITAFGLFILLVTRFHGTGAAIAAALCPAPLMFLQASRLAREIGQPIRLARLRRAWPLAAWLVLVLVVRHQQVPWILGAIGTSIAYAAVVFFSDLLRVEEREKIAALLRPLARRVGA